MKRFFILFVSVLLILSGCAGAQESSPEPTPTPEPTPEPVFESGERNESQYTNTFLSLSFALPENWTFASNKEFEELLGIGTQQLESNMQIAHTPGDSTFYEFYALGSAGESVIMTVEDLSAHDGGESLSVEQFIDTLSTQYNNITTVEYMVGDSYEQQLASHDCMILPLSVEEAGVYQHNCVFRSGDYMVTITISAHSEEELSSLFEQFSSNT